MSKLKKILYIGGGRDIIETLRIARGLNIEIHYIQKPELFKEEIRPLVHSIHLFDYENDLLLKKTLIELHEVECFDSVYSLNENALIAAAKAREFLGLKGNSLETVVSLKNKHLMRQRLLKNEFSHVRSMLGSDAKDVQNFLDIVKSEIIIKPLDGSGSFSVFQIRSIDDFHSVSELLRTNGMTQFIMEEFLHGSEYSVESFSEDGVHKVITITEKRILPNFVEIGHTVPASLPTNTAMEIHQFIHTFLDILKVIDGPTHTEIILTKNGPRIVESHDRTGGDKINELVRLSYGIDMKELAFRRALGEKVLSKINNQIQKSSSIQFLTASPGKVIEILGLEQAESHSGVEDLFLYIKKNDDIAPIRDSLDRAGYVIATGSTADESKQIAESICSSIQILTQSN